MKVAYVDVNVRYLNRTRDELLNALKSGFDLTCVGPGFSKGDPVEHLQSVLNADASADVVVMTPHVALAAALADRSCKEIAELYRRSFSFSFDENLFGSLASLNSFLAASSVPKALFLLEADYYNFGAFEIDAFSANADIIFGFGPECWAPKSSMHHLNEEAFAGKATDCWADFLASNDYRVSALHHLVGEDEFCTTPLAVREHGWSVMGANYAARGVAIDTLRAHCVKPLVTSAKRKIVGGLKRLGLLRGESDFTLNLVQGDFHRKLCNSRYSYTCGSGLDMPIRKFFEIPAAGAVLVCRPFRGARQLGFVAGEHYLECEPEDIWDAHRYLESNPDAAQRMAQSGQSLVRRLHSVPARAEQLRQSLEAVVSHSGVGRWCNGRFEIRSSTPLGLPQSLGCQQ